MIKILIMDDLQEKIDAILKVLTEGCGINTEAIDVAKSISSGKVLLRKNRYDLLILDLVIPNFDDEDPDPNGGLKFARELDTSAQMKMPSQVIALTIHEDIFKDEKDEFEHLALSLVLMKSGSAEWQERLSNEVDKAIKRVRAMLNSLKEEKTYDVGIICALQDEFLPMLRILGKDKWENIGLENSCTPYQFKRSVITTASGSRIKVIAACANCAGVIPTSILATCMYQLFSVDIIFMTGFAAGFSFQKARLGDVVVAQSIMDYSAGKVEEDIEGNIKFLSEIKQIQAPADVTAKFSEMLADSDMILGLNRELSSQNVKVDERINYMAQIAPTVCGPYVVASGTVAKLVAEPDRKLFALDMEGFGLYLTAHNLGKKALWIKGVSDFADKDKNDNYHKHCAYASAYLLYMYIKEYM